MSIIISLGYEAQNPRTLYVMENEAAAIAHAERFCSSAGIELDPAKLRVRADVNGRTFVVQWTWPREVHGIWKKSTRWVFLYAGVELTRIELHTLIPTEDLNYLIGRMRGKPLDSDDKQEGINP